MTHPAPYRLMRKMRRPVLAYAVGLLTMLSACRTAGQRPLGSPDSQSASVWSVDLVRTLPGAQMDYMRSIETNWANGRKVANARGAVLAYRAFVAPPDSARGWDVLLMTEYADSASYLRREAIFESIFASPEYVRVEPARPSQAMRTFSATNVPMRIFVSQPPR